MKNVDLRGKLTTHKTKKYNTRKVSEISSLAIHHSLTLSGSAQAFATYQVNTNGWPGIAYTYVIDKDGTINQCLDYTQVGYHVGNSNKHALGICLVGDFRSQIPTEVQYSAALWLVRKLQSELPNAVDIKGHSEYPGYSWKECPVINMFTFRADVKGKDEEAMTEEERKEMDSLKEMVATQASAIQNLEKLLEKVDPPNWLVNEFGIEYMNSKINEPKMTAEGWRTVAIAWRSKE